MSTQELNDLLGNLSETTEQRVNNGKRVQLIVFKLGAEEYALPIDQIKEVVITPHVAQVPRTPDHIKGVANIRGNVIAIMDLEDKFNLKNISNTSKNEIQYNYTLVIESDEHKVGILVNEVPNTLNTFESAIDNSSNVMQYSSLDEDCITGIVKVDSRMIILIDIIKMVRNEEFEK